MKTLNKWEIQQIAFNHPSDIQFQQFMNLYQKFTAKPYSFLVTDATVASNNSSRIRKNNLEKQVSRRVRLLSMCNDELSAVIVQLMSKCLWSGWSGSKELKKSPPSSPAVLRFVNVCERKTQIEKEIDDKIRDK